MYKFEQVDQLARYLEMYYDDPTCRWEHYERMAGDLYESGCRYAPDEDELLDQIACLEQDIADVKSRTVREMQERLKAELRSGNAIMDKSISDIVNRVAEEILTEED